MPDNLDQLVSEIPNQLDSYAGVREILLANAVMFGEIPSPTFGESRRIQFMADRLLEEGLADISIDEEGNALGRMPGKKGKRNILLVAHADTHFPTTVDHAMTMDTERIVGPGIANNSLGLATVAILPSLLEKLEIELDSNLLLLGSVKSHGRADLGGLRFFIDHHGEPIHQAICVEGVHLGRLSYSSLGMIRAEISAEVPEVTTWHHFGRISASRILTRILNRLYAIPIPREPKTSINIGTVKSGNTYSDMTTSGLIRFEVRSEDVGEVERIRNAIEEIVEVTSLENRMTVKLEPIASRTPGGISYGHPMVVAARKIMKALDVEPHIAPSVGDLSPLIAKKIPTLTLGLTTGENLNMENESVNIKPLDLGVAQLISMLVAVDRGYCDEKD